MQIDMIQPGFALPCMTRVKHFIYQHRALSAGDETDDQFKESIQRVRDHLHSSQSSAAVCLICLENMKKEDAVWHCSKGCCCVLHLLCIQAWSRQQLAAASYKASQDTSRSASTWASYSLSALSVVAPPVVCTACGLYRCSHCLSFFVSPTYACACCVQSTEFLLHIYPAFCVASVTTTCPMCISSCMPAACV